MSTEEKLVRPMAASSRIRWGQATWACQLLVAVVAFCAADMASAQCGVGGIYSGNCVKFKWDPPQQTVFVGETVEVRLIASSVNGFSQPAQSMQAVFEWDPGAMELLGNKTCIGGSNDGAVCLNGSECPGGACEGPCAAPATATPICYQCSGTPSGYNWASEVFPNDEFSDRLNADCGPDTFCSPYTGIPYNDGNASITASKQFVCNGTTAPPPEIGPGGMVVAKLLFRADAPGSTQVYLRDDGAACAQHQKICQNGLNIDLPCTDEYDCPDFPGPSPQPQRKCLEQNGTVCVTDADCPPGVKCDVWCTACQESFCCDGVFTPCTNCSFTDTRVIGGLTAGYDVTAPPSLNNPAVINISNCFAPTARAAGPRYIEVDVPDGTDPVAIGVRGVGPNNSCITGYVATSGFVSSTPTYQLPSAWGRMLARDTEILDDSDYEVWLDCNESSPGTSESSPVSVRTWKWADGDNDGTISVLDFVAAIDGFRGNLVDNTPCSTDAQCAAVGPNYQCFVAQGTCYKVQQANVDLVNASGCQPDGVVNIIDIVQHVDRFRGLPVPCTSPCVP